MLDVFRPEGRLSWRKLRVLIEQLPPDSATKHTIAGVELDPWSITDHLLAYAGDRLAELVYVTTKANSKKRAKVQKPKLLPRPGDDASESKAEETPTVRPSALKQWIATGEVVD